MKRLSIKVFVLSILSAMLVLSATAQQEFVLDSDNSKLKITGTSSVHDWEMSAEMFSCETTVELDSQRITSINAIDFSVKVEDLESGKRIMNNKAHDALKEKRHPEIRFRFDSGDPVTITEGEAKLAGTLNIAGKSRKVELAANFNQVRNNRFSVNGMVPLKMTDFDIEPPTAMLGAIETGDEITVNFDFKFTKTPDQISDISPVK
jgi:polyisoprenoid-binding protein YceI